MTEGWGKLCLVYSLFQSMSWPGWQLVNLSHRRDKWGDKIWKWQLFLFVSVFDTSSSLCVIPSLMCNHKLTFHCHHAFPVCQAWKQARWGKKQKEKLPCRQMAPPQKKRNVLIASDSNHWFSSLCPCHTTEQQPHITVIRLLQVLQLYTAKRTHQTLHCAENGLKDYS